MTRLRNNFPILLFIFAAVSLAVGCSQFLEKARLAPPSTPLTKVYLLRTDYTAAMHVLVQARQLGKISDEQYKQIEVSRKQAASALDALESAASSGQPLDASLLNQAQVAVDALIASKNVYK